MIERWLFGATASEPGGRTPARYAATLRMNRKADEVIIFDLSPVFEVSLDLD